MKDVSDDGSFTMEPSDLDMRIGVDGVDNARISPSVAVSAAALTLALKYHDINTIQDGALYQQYKLEGRNIRDLHFDMVLETAMRIEAWFLSSEDRMAKMMQQGIAEQLVGTVVDLLGHMAGITDPHDAEVEPPSSDDGDAA